MVLRPSKSPLIAVNLLLALAISLVVNFSYLLLLILDKKEEPHRVSERFIEMSAEGVLRMSLDGHGYILYSDAEIDSVYAPQPRIRRLGLQDGDRLVVSLGEPFVAGGHYVMAKVLLRNGDEFEYGSVFSRPSGLSATLHQLLFYLGMAFVLLTIVTSGGRRKPIRFSARLVWCLLAAALLYLMAPSFERHTGRMVMNVVNSGHFDFVLMLKCSFTLVVTLLFGWIYRLGAQRQVMVVENERLRSENLQTRYNMLVGQVNPHFFFNSLNSLAMLVREKHDNKALTYIDQLSYTFRYILRNGQAQLVPLDEELRFVEAYAYLFKIRYADKLFFDIDIAPGFRMWTLPALTLQPIIDNAVKHNAITHTTPLHVSIRIEQECLVISNPLIPRLEPEPGTGIGLENLRNRWKLITGCEVIVEQTTETFTVRLPLQKPGE